MQLPQIVVTGYRMELQIKDSDGLVMLVDSGPNILLPTDDSLRALVFEILTRSLAHLAGIDLHPSTKESLMGGFPQQHELSVEGRTDSLSGCHKEQPDSQTATCLQPLPFCK